MSMGSKTEEIRHKLGEILEPLGLECYPLKIGWYNEKVNKAFHFSLPYDTLAFVIISTPHMFDKAFKPYLWRLDCTGPGDLLDSCMQHHFMTIQEFFAGQTVECIHDYELHSSRRPKVLVQTAAHVAGAVYYYQRTDVKNDPWPADQNIYGVCVHPKYGGWFAIRGLFLFHDVLVPDLEQHPPPDILPDDSNHIEVLERFNFHHEDWQFRDIIEPQARYSDLQKKYFFAPPGSRDGVIREILDEKPSCIDASDLSSDTFDDEGKSR